MAGNNAVFRIGRSQMRNLSVSSRLTLVCVFYATVITFVAGALLLNQKYRSQVDEIIHANRELVDGNPGLQFAVYFRDRDLIASHLKDEVKDPYIGYAAFRDDGGRILAQKISGFGRSLPDAAADRSGSEGIRIQRRDLYVGSSPYLDVLIPVYASVDPLKTPRNTTAYDAAFANYRASRSRHFIGTYQIGIDLTSVRASLAPFARQMAIALLLCLALFGLLVAIVVQWMTRPLKQLADFAQGISAGRLNSPLRVRGGGEVAKLMTSLNAVFDELAKYKSLIDVDNKLLTMKVEERTRQLTLRNEELNRAVKEISEAETRLKQLAYFDSLTALPNRQLFLEKLGDLLERARHDGELMGLLYMDLDNFKRINDSLGHSIGDKLLKAVADRMSHCLRADDFLAIFNHEDEDRTLGISRLGGDEFTVILKDIETDDAAKIAERILESLKKPFSIDGHDLVVTPSIGIAIFPTDSDRVEELVKMADTAMYQAKKTGKNNYRFYSPEMTLASVDELQVEADLRKALAGNEISLYFQPQVDVTNGKIVGAEALARWEHADKGFISPVRFIPLAEELGIIQELGLWVIRTACKQLKEIQALGLDVPEVSVNVSPLQFSSSFAAEVRAILEELNVAPNMLMLELTEGTLMREEDFVVEALFELKAMGIRLAIDDFGTGYSSLSYLTKFPIDELKIDRSFVVKIADPDNSTSRSLIEAIVAMATSMNLEIVAEGVDDPRQMEYLREQGVQLIQGYLFSKPMQFEEFVLFLEDNPFPKNLVRMSRQAVN